MLVDALCPSAGCATCHGQPSCILNIVTCVKTVVFPINAGYLSTATKPTRCVHPVSMGDMLRGCLRA